MKLYDWEISLSIKPYSFVFCGMWHHLVNITYCPTSVLQLRVNPSSVAKGAPDSKWFLGAIAFLQLLVESRSFNQLVCAGFDMNIGPSVKYVIIYLMKIFAFENVEK